MTMHSKMKSLSEKFNKAVTGPGFEITSGAVLVVAGTITGLLVPLLALPVVGTACTGGGVAMFHGLRRSMKSFMSGG